MTDRKAPDKLTGMVARTGLLIFESVSRTFGTGKERIEVFKNISFKMFAGEIVAVTGPNGSGKTTFLRLACGGIFPDEGRILVGSPGIDSKEDVARKFVSASVLGERSLYWRLSVLENVRFFAALRDDPGMLERFTGIAANLGLAALLERPVYSLSTGQRKRVLLAKALAAGAELYLLDEPASSMDGGGLEALENILRNYSREKCGIVFTSSGDRRLLSCATRELMILKNSLVEEKNGGRLCTSG